MIEKQHRLTTFRGIVRTPKKSADALVFCFSLYAPPSKLAAVTKFAIRSGGPGGLPELDRGLELVMGIEMKKVALLATALAMVATGSAFAADMHVKALKAPPPPAFDPWDIAFGGAVMNDYIFRGVTQSNHKPSVAAYFEPRYNVTKDLQLYVGVSGESISFANRAAAEIDIYGGIRPTFGAFAFDIGVWGYLYPGGTCYYGAANAFNGGTRIRPASR